MTIKDVRESVKAIEAKKADYESAFSDEVMLYRDVLTVIAKGHKDSKNLAKEALKAAKITMPRYTA